MTRKLTTAQLTERKQKREQDRLEAAKKEERRLAFEALPDVLELKLCIAKDVYQEWRRLFALRGMMGDLHGMGDAVSYRILEALEARAPSLYLALPAPEPKPKPKPKPNPARARGGRVVK